MYRYHRKELVTEMRIYEIKMIKPLTPDQARVKSMQDQVKRTQQAIKTEKARQKIKAGQDRLSKLNNQSSNNLI
jgi:hypothetical protein